MARKQYRVAAGERVRVVDRRSGSVPREYVITSAPAAGGGRVSGSVEVQGSFWLSRKPPVTMPLEAEVRVVKGFWDTLFRVTVAPDVDVDVTVG